MARARDYRKKPTVAERLLWKRLRALGQNWRRQSPCGRYVLDFVRRDILLIIEVDGYWHTIPERRAHDAERDHWLTGEWYRVLHFTAHEVEMDLDRVLSVICAASGEAPPSPTLSPTRGEGRVDA